MSGLFGYLSVRTPRFPCFLLGLTVLFRRATVRAVKGKDFVLQVLRNVVRVFNLLLHRTVMVVTYKDRGRVFANDLIRPFKRRHKIRGGKRRFLTRLFRDLSFNGQRYDYVRALCDLPRRFKDGSQGRLFTAVIVVGTIERPCPLRMRFRDLRVEDVLVSLVTNVSDFRRPTGHRIVLTVLIRGGISTLRDHFHRVVGRFFLFRKRVLGA